MHFSLKKIFRKNFFLFTFDKRQTIEGYGKCIRSSVMVSGTVLMKNNAFFAKKVFRKIFFYSLLTNVRLLKSMKNAFAVQLWSPALYRRNIMHFSHKKIFSVKIFFYSLLTNVRLLKATENAFAAQLWSPALY